MTTIVPFTDTITENGTYSKTAPANTAYSPINITVNVPTNLLTLPITSFTPRYQSSGLRVLPSQFIKQTGSVTFILPAYTVLFVIHFESDSFYSIEVNSPKTREDDITITVPSSLPYYYLTVPVPVEGAENYLEWLILSNETILFQFNDSGASYYNPSIRFNSSIFPIIGLPE